jgi:hypothetical protein
MDHVNGRAKEVTVTYIARTRSVTRPSSLHMCGEFGEIDLATGMHLQTIIVDESGEEPEVRKTLSLFTETDSNDSVSL